MLNDGGRDGKKDSNFNLYMLFQCFLNKVIKTEDKHGPEVCNLWYHEVTSNCQIITLLPYM